MLQSAGALALDAFVPPLAPLVQILFLGSGFAVFCATVAAAIAAAAGRAGLARVLGGGAMTVAVGYWVLLLGASLVSRERTLSAGEKKYFCEMDCHLAYSVEGSASPERGRRVVTVRTWFDPGTIAPFRGNAPLAPNPRIVYLVDDSGRRYSPSPSPVPEDTSLARPLRPGESYVSTFAFTVPPRAGSLRLFVGDAPGLENVIVNHENSPFHARTYFALPAASAGIR